MREEDLQRITWDVKTFLIGQPLQKIFFKIFSVSLLSQTKAVGVAVFEA
jgi:hypothetical protein